MLAGAGFDTFAWRQPDWAKGLSIIEVDHPATQAAKQEMVAQAGLDVPDNLRFVPVDFTRQTLAEALAGYGLGLDQAVYFSWLGVSMYLEPAATERTLRAMAAFAPGSGRTMTFKQPPASDPSQAKANAKLAQAVETAGEAFVGFFTQAEMEAELKRCGFDQVWFLEPEAAVRSYFTPSRRDLPPPRQTNIASAWK